VKLLAESPVGTASARWKSQRLLAVLVQVVVLVVPLAAGFAAGSLVARHVEPQPGALGALTWWLVVLGAATLASHSTGKTTRRLAPLPALLRSTMVFPDRAPSRFRMSLRTRDTELLRRQLVVATKGGYSDLAQATQVILSLGQALSKHDRNTRGHSERTGAYADLIAREMGMKQEERDKLRWAAVLHDIGKLEVPASVLNKPGALSAAEYDIVKCHPEHGMSIIAPIRDWLGPFADGIGQHHEHWDGNGYPHGLSGNDIAVAARIISVADAYDVMTTGRIYQPRVSHAAARREIADKSGTQFDPRVARALLNLSVGRMRWISGPIAALADPRLLRSLELVGRDVATVIAAGALTVAATLEAGGLPRSPLADPILEAAGTVATTTSAVANPNSPLPTGRPGGSIPPATASTTEVTSALAPTASTTAPPSTTFPPPTAPPSTTAPPTTAPPTTTSPPTTTPPTTAPTTTTMTTTPGALSAANDAATTKPSNKVNIDVLANDLGVGPGAALSVARTPAHGTVRFLGGGKLQYDAGTYTGVDTFEYQVCNANGSCDTATVTVTVAG